MKKRTIYIILIFAVVVLWAAMPASASNKTIRVSTSYRNLLSNPECSGMLDRIVQEAFRRIGVRAEIVFTNTRRSLVDVNDGVLDAEINRIEGMERSYPNLVQVPEPNMQMHFVAFAKEDIPISGWGSIRRLRVGMVQGWKILEQHTKNFPNLTSLTEISKLFELLERDRLDVVLYSKLTGYEELYKLGYKDIQALSPPLVVKDMFLYLNKSHKDLATPMAEALREMKQDGTYDKIIDDTACHQH